MRVALLAGSCSLFLIACASTPGVVAIGPDTYMVSRQAASGFTGNSGLMAAAMREAGAYCAARGKTLQVVRTDEAKPPFLFGNFPRAEVQFMCLATNDPELARPKLQPTPDVVVSVGAAPAGSTPINAPPAAKVPVAIDSQPAGADVTIDGAFVGNTPLPDFKLAPGEHQIDISRAGFETWSRRITVAPDTPSRINANLTTKSAQ